MSEENKVILRTISSAFTGKGDMAKAIALIPEDGVDHQGLPGIDTRGPEGFKRVVETYRAAFPDVSTTEVAMIAEGDLVMMHFHMTGTNSGPFMGMPATGKKVDIMGVDIIRCVNGKAVEHWGYMEEGKMMQQLGLMPPQ